MPVTRSAMAKLVLTDPAQVDRSGTESLTSTLVSGSPPNSAALESDTGDHAVANKARKEDHSDASATSSASDDDTSSDDDSDSETNSDDEDDTGSIAQLQALLQKAKGAARERAQKAKEVKAKGGGEDDGLAGNEEMVLFGDEEEEEEDEEASDEEDNSTPKASTSRLGSSSTARRPAPLPPSLARPLSASHPLLSTSSSAKRLPSGISLAQDLGAAVMVEGRAAASGRGEVGSKGERGKGKAVVVGDRWGMAPQPKLSKKQFKANQPRTAGKQWFDLPATPMTPELKRELDALRLSNSLDPKKFLRQGAKKDKVGEFFQIGHVIAPSTRATTLSTPAIPQKRTFVEDLMEDEASRAYAKRKTKEVMAKTMSGRKRQRKGAKGSYAMGASGNGREKKKRAL
ncbi:deoxynucleotidyltransferase [Rhodotorula toruloides]|uniref:Deoxynucleotidyltransferase n=1 Tax=Rhodotorula toruloides TaxID=5286 RepID=A0A511KLM6_RHOTO|nr:deoxynucleotidyltransferase [Rhodotorula toruloides]